jgi:hypothetical protein
MDPEGVQSLGSNPKDLRFFKRVQDAVFKSAKITAFGSTRRPGVKPQEDSNIQALVEAGPPVVTIFGKSWDLHVTHALGTTLDENVAMIGDSVAYLLKHFEEVIYDAEHFFDGFKKNREYALTTLKAAEAAGAHCLVLCDTNGGGLPHEVAAIVREVKKHVKGETPLGIHVHNDTECAVANTLAAIMDDNPGKISHHINGTYPEGEPFSTMPANILAVLPRLPDDIQYRFLGRHLILYDTRASLILDRIPYAIRCGGRKSTRRRLSIGAGCRRAPFPARREVHLARPDRSRSFGLCRSPRWTRR